MTAAMRVRTALVVSSMGLLLACTAWSPRTGVLTQPLPVRDQIQLCAHGKCHQVHAVKVFGDSVSGVPFFQAPDCDSCALHFALKDLDAVKTSHVDRDRTIILGLALSPLLYALAFAIAMVGSGD